MHHPQFLWFGVFLGAAAVLAQSLGFRTAPATAPTDEFTFYVIGDYGAGRKILFL
jgi:hypothetical protein